MSQSRSIATNTIAQTIGKVISVALGWVTVLLMTNTLGALGFGAYTIMTAYLQFFGVAADFGFVLVSSQLLAERPQEQQRIFANLFTFRLATAGIILAIAPFAIWAFPYSPLIKQGVVILTFSFLLAALMQVYTGLFQKELVVGRVLIGEILSRFVLLGFIGWAIWSHQGLLLMVFGIVVGAAVNIVLLATTAKKFVQLRLAFDRDVWVIIWQRSWPLITTIVLNLIYLKADTLILSLTRSQAEVGVYGAAYRVFEVLITFPTMFASLLVPILAGARARGDMQSFSRIARQGFKAMVFAIVPMVIGVFFVAQPFAALFGHDFIFAGPRLLKLLVIANAFVFLGTYCAHLVVAANQQRRMIIPFGVTAAVALVGYLVFIPRFGAVGAAVMTDVAEFIIALFSGYVAWQVTRVALPLWSSFKTSIIAALPMALWLVVAPVPVLVRILIAVIVYGAMLVVLGEVPQSLLGFSKAADDTNIS